VKALNLPKLALALKESFGEGEVVLPVQFSDFFLEDLKNIANI
jgi:hypothetical protein